MIDKVGLLGVTFMRYLLNVLVILVHFEREKNIFLFLKKLPCEMHPSHCKKQKNVT